MHIEIGILTQLAFILIVIGLLCVRKPYETAKWHHTDPEMQEREHKREQSHKKKKDRVAFDPSTLEEDYEPSQTKVTVIRVLGAIVLAAGIALMIWSFT